MVSVCGDEVAILEPGDVFGEISFALAQPATADVVAKTDVSVLVLQPHQLDRLIENRPRLAGALYRSLSTELARRLSKRLLEAQQPMLQTGSTLERHRSLLSGAESSIY